MLTENTDDDTMDKKQYVRWYKLARAAVGDSKLIPERTDSDIIDNQVSKDNWLNLSPVKNLEEVASSVNPNIWFSIHEDGTASIGVHFNNKDSMEKIGNILSSACDEQKTELLSVMRDLDDTWETTLSRKIKESHPRQSPDYHDEWDTGANELDDDAIEELFKRSQKIFDDGNKEKEERKDIGMYYSETPTLNLVECEFDLKDEEFKKRILIAHEILGICYNVKTNTQIKKELRKVLENKRTEITSLKKLIKLDSKIVKKEVSDKRKAKILELEKEIMNLEKELL